MKQKILKLIFSLGAGLGFTLLIYFVLGFILLELLKIDEDTFSVFLAVVMGTIVFGILSCKTYDYLKK